MTDGEGSALEQELSCQICTDLLYQPLTLLDCLHTFCGACLKEWFAFQASTATSLHPYTCPSCRASVRTAQPINATVTTLLDLFVKSNPGKGKSEQEKKSDRDKYKPGDNVLPKLRRKDEGREAEEERRMVEEAARESLREAGISGSSGALEPPRERRRRERGSRDTSREGRHEDRERSQRRSRSRNTHESSNAPRRDVVVPQRQVEHQSSLRSLLSASEVDSQEMEEEIMRQIMEEGLLDGIDLNNIDVAQEDEISERIAQAYRRRQHQRQRERRERRERLAREGRIESANATPLSSPPARSPQVREEEQVRRRPHGRSESGTSIPPGGSNRPPVSRPGLIDAANQGTRTRHRRSSSQGSSRSARRADRPSSLSVSSNRQAAHSATDLGERPMTSESASPGRRRLSDNQRSGATEDRQQFRNALNAHPSSNPNSPRRTVFETTSSTAGVVASPLSSPATSNPPTSLPPPNSRRTTDPTHVRQAQPSDQTTTPVVSPLTIPRSTTDPSAVESRSRASSAARAPPPTLYPEPSIVCKRCKKGHIEYQLHYNCSRCDGGDYNICLSCYRLGKGCKHWFGFGWAAWANYERQGPHPPNAEHPHILIGRQYRRPLAPFTDSPHGLQSEDDPTHRLEAGVFCEVCFAYANACYWKCDTCNEGAWGYCNDCVNQGKHCTHPLLPVTHKPKTSPHEPSVYTMARPETSHQAGPLSPGLLSPAQDPEQPTIPPLTPKTASVIRGPGLITIVNAIFKPLTFTTVCNICTYPVPPSHTRYHCSQCQAGDYDICTSCYHKLVSTGRISREDGMNGWRRCLRGHRMVVIGFEDRDGGQRRVVVRDLVGGHALKEDESMREQEVQSPTLGTVTAGSPNANTLATPYWSWRDDDGSIRKHRSSHSQSQSPITSTPQAAINTNPKFPPDGGVGLRVQTIWGYWPDESVSDELAFPKYAEIREAEDINGDWLWGVYCGVGGLFPGSYGRVIGRVSI